MKYLIKTIFKTSLLFIIFSSFFISYDSVIADTIRVNVTEDLSPLLENCTTTACYVPKWAWAITEMMWAIIKYFTFLAWLWAVLFIVINWILYSMSWVDQSMKEKAKERITKTLMWLIVLLLSWVILNMIAPWIYEL